MSDVKLALLYHSIKMNLNSVVKSLNVKMNHNEEA